MKQVNDALKEIENCNENIKVLKSKIDAEREKRDELNHFIYSLKTNIKKQIILARFAYIKSFKEFKFDMFSSTLNSTSIEIQIEISMSEYKIYIREEDWISIYQLRLKKFLHRLQYDNTNDSLIIVYGDRSTKLDFSATELLLYVCRNFKQIKNYTKNLDERMDTLLKNYLTATEFLLCTLSSQFPREIRYIIANKILFASHRPFGFFVFQKKLKREKEKMKQVNEVLIKHFIPNPERYKLVTNIPFLKFQPLTNGFYMELNLMKFDLAYITFKSNKIEYSGTTSITHFPGSNCYNDVQFYFCVKNDTLCIDDWLLEDVREGWKKAVPYHKLYMETYPHVVELLLLIYKHRHKIYKLISNISTYNDTIKKINTFLLCRPPFPREIRHIITNKILFF